LTTARDQLWAINALEAAAKRALTEMDTAWPLAAIYFVVNPKLSKDVRFAAISMITNVFVSTPSDIRCKAANRVVLGIEEWIRQA
jgi:hypothetical protein